MQTWLTTYIPKMKSFSVIQYNCGNANRGACRPFFDSVSPAEHQVLAIQEPSYNRFTKSTYCPRNFILTYNAAPTTKVCFMVSRSIDAGHWKRQQFGPCVATLWIRLEGREVTIINVYKPQGETFNGQALSAVREALELAKGEVMLLGDFNMHHPAWGGIHVTGETQAERLLHEIEAKGLKLATPRGEPTWKRGQCESVIDLTFLSDGLYKRLSFCGTKDRWALTKDHIPICIQIDAAVYPTTERRRFAIGKLDQTTFLQKVQRLE